MRHLLPLMPKPSRYTGIEEGAVHKQLHNLELHCALAFPDTYEVGMSYLGQKILYDIMNANPLWWAERVMAPCREAAAVLREHQQPLCTLESDTPLAHVHCLGFSVTHELCYTNILYMLDLAGIPLYSSQRSADGDSLLAWPIVMAGGGATLSAEPLAPFMDLMVLGEGEESMPDIARLLVKARAAGWPRSQFLHEARHIAGVYVPSLFAAQANGSVSPLLDDYPQAMRRVVSNLDAADYPVQQVVPIGAVHNRLSLEIARGCTRGCRFCHAGMVYRPVRERSLGSLHGLLEECLAHTGFDEVSFLSLSTGDFSALKTLFTSTMDRCSREQISVSLPSLRVGSIDDSIMERMSTIRRTGATLAPEAGSQRLRDVINKGITEDEL
ncbi:MAG: B12-binding domain-containing radical SAM protein, partial [Desulfovibrionaceae bacterium]